MPSCPDDKRSRVLVTNGWLAEQDASFQAWVLSRGRWQSYRPGASLFEAGDEPDGLYGVASGAVEVAFPRAGEEEVAVSRSSTGFWIGDAALLSQKPRMVTVRATHPVEALFLPAGAIRQLLAEEPRHWPAFYVLSYTNARNAWSLLSEALSLPTQARLARRLLALDDGGGRIEVTQQDLARLLGVTRSTVQRALQDLSENGCLSLCYSAIIINSRHTLATIASG